MPGTRRLLRLLLLVLAVLHKPCSIVHSRCDATAAATPNRSDREICEAIAQGRDWAAEALYERVQPVVDQCLRRILRSTGPDYDDLMQAAFERIITVLSKKPLGGKCDLRAWSAAVATHVALDSLRRRVRERRLFQSDAEMPPHCAQQSSVEGRLEARADIHLIQHILAKMKPNGARTLLLHDVLGYELLEIAQMMGVSVAAAQSRLVRARNELLRRAGENAKGRRT